MWKVPFKQPSWLPNPYLPAPKPKRGPRRRVRSRPCGSVTSRHDKGHLRMGWERIVIMHDSCMPLEAPYMVPTFKPPPPTHPFPRQVSAELARAKREHELLARDNVLLERVIGVKDRYVAALEVAAPRSDAWLDTPVARAVNLGLPLGQAIGVKCSSVNLSMLVPPPVLTGRCTVWGVVFVVGGWVFELQVCIKNEAW